MPITSLFNILYRKGFLEWADFSDTQYSSESAENFESIAALSNADVLLAADVVYDVQCIPDLVNTISSFLSGNVGRKTALFATTYRNKRTFDLFEGELKKKNVSCDYVSIQLHKELPDIFPCYFNQPRGDVRICTMKLN